MALPPMRFKPEPEEEMTDDNDKTNWTKIRATWLVAGIFMGGIITWLSAPEVIARDCERLGAFHVGDKVFACAPVGDE